MDDYNIIDGEIMFTSAAILDLLLQIDELKGYDISIAETIDDGIRLQINDSIYILTNDNISLIGVDDEIVDEIQMTADDAYDEIIENTDIIEDINDPIDRDTEYLVEGGIIKEAIKSLALGGVIKFARKYLL